MYAQVDCAGRCTLEWARSLLLMRGDPDEAERTWWLASVAFLEGVRDWRFLHTPNDSLNPFGPALGHIAHGLERFPGESRLRFAQTFAVGNRFLVVTEAAPRGPVPGAAPELMTVVMSQSTAQGNVITNYVRPSSIQLRQVVALRDSVEAALAALADDAVVGPEARVRLGYLHWTGGQDDAARIQLRAAADIASADADVPYLAWFLLGLVSQSRGDADTARVEFERALIVRPNSQSAALALAALQFQRGEIDSADEVVRTALKRPSADDPWRQFLYGSYRTLPGLVTQLREHLRQ
jgi:tetratricopeptide (TPR) repeat protein